jgi:septum formation protein
LTTRRPSAWGGAIQVVGNTSIVTTLAPPLVLASGSKARLRVLRDAGFDPRVVVSGADESVENVSTSDAVAVIAERKASVVAPQCRGTLVLACDSLLELDGASLGKPTSEAEIVEVWRRISGREGQLFTGHCLIDTRSGDRLCEVVSTLIKFGSPTDQEIKTYAESGEALELAGSFSIDGRAGPFVEGIEGSPSNVLGLSLPHFRLMLARLGVQITDLWIERFPSR